MECEVKSAASPRYL